MITRAHLRSALPRMALLLLAVASGCGGSAASTDGETRDPISLTRDQIAIVEVQELSTGPGLSGTLEPYREATLRAEIPGAVISTHVDAGQAVQRGMRLARIDDRVWRDQFLSAQTAQRLAKERLHLAERNLERAQRLAEAGAIAERDLENARIERTNAEAAAAEATARLASATQQLAHATILAPFTGVVSERQADAGDVLQTGNPIVTIVDPSMLRLEATVPVTALASLKVGMTVAFVVTGITDRSFAGQIDRVNPTVDPATRQMRMQVLLPNTDGKLVAGLFARGRVATEQSSTIAIPEDAIDFAGPTPTARRIRGGVVESVGIVLGVTDEAQGLVAITSGLAVGDTILVGSAQTIAIGTPVRLREE